MADAKKEEPTKPTPEEKLAAAEAEVDALVKKGLKALDDFEKLDQKQVDRIVAKASVAALNKHLVLAKMAVEETGRGLVEDKATKNIFACEHVTNYLAGQKTVGIIREDDVMGIDEIAEPVGVVGSRGVSEYGRQSAHELAKQAARAGHLIVSGGALGTDAAAHWGAIQPWTRSERPSQDAPSRYSPEDSTISVRKATSASSKPSSTIPARSSRNSAPEPFRKPDDSLSGTA